MATHNLTEALARENPAAQANAIINLLAAACTQPGWAVFVHNNGETTTILAGQLTGELAWKILAALAGEEEDN
jgi:hypothetical protein